MEPLHMHKLLGHDVERIDPKDPGRGGATHRIVDVAYCERERCWQLFVLDLHSGELDVWMVGGKRDIRIIGLAGKSIRNAVPHRNGGPG